MLIARLPLLGTTALVSQLVLGQCDILVPYTQVPYITGTAVIEGTTITVTPIGYTLNYADCGSNSGPYLCGTLQGPGGYTINFVPAVSGVMLHFSALHSTAAYDEVMVVSVDDEIYPIPQAGTELNVCQDELAILTPEGYVGGNPNGNSSGWNGTVIPGPINELKVWDNILVGQPGGAFFSLFFCSSNSTAVASNHMHNVELHPNPATSAFFVTGPVQEAVNLFVTDLTGRTVSPPVRLIPGIESRITTEHLAPGEYLVHIHGTSITSVYKLMIVGG